MVNLSPDRYLGTEEEREPLTDEFKQENPTQRKHHDQTPKTWTKCTGAITFMTIFACMALIFLNLSPFISRKPVSNDSHRSACVKYPEDCKRTAPFIFDSILSLLKQWPNSYAPNGDIIVTASIPPNTQVYHVRPDGQLRKTPTFHAFDAEMSLGIYGNSGTPRMFATVTTKQLKVLYFDGASAALSQWATLDLQMALLQNKVPERPPDELIYDEDARGKDLCNLAAELHIDGFVRMNAGFELLVCDSTASGVIEAFNADVTIPGNEEREKDRSLPQDPNRLPPHGFGNEFAPQAT